MPVKSFREFCKEEYDLKTEDRKKETQRKFARTFGTVPEDIRDGKVYIR